MSSEMETVLFEDGPLHGARRVRIDQNGFAITTGLETGYYRYIGRTEAGFRLFRWEERS